MSKKKKKSDGDLAKFAEWGYNVAFSDVKQPNWKKYVAFATAAVVGGVVLHKLFPKHTKAAWNGIKRQLSSNKLNYVHQ